MDGGTGKEREFVMFASLLLLTGLLLLARGRLTVDAAEPGYLLSVPGMVAPR
ncbi:MAG: hypothetical protein HUU15_04030 [Candidatus Brocadiae bacterium]|nr:hypothetical protein [Candidatus Brocadiia bacterium]